MRLAFPGIRWLLLLTSAFLCTAVSAQIITGRVVSVHDGDTLTLLDDSKHQHKVRLATIDAPELKQPFGQVSRKYLTELVAGKA